MTFADLVAGAHVFVDANSLIYHFSPHPVFGSACKQLVADIENQTLFGYTSPHIVGEVSHALMIIEALSLPGWGVSNVPKRLKKQPVAVQQLTRFQQAVEDIFQSRLQVLSIRPDLLLKAVVLSRQFGLLTNDALLVAIMQDHGLTALASHDADFDRVPGIMRYSPA
jgi:predicted nucleic acid-binding protein